MKDQSECPPDGLTATPHRMKSGSLCAPENLLNHVCRDRGKELINQGHICPLIPKAGRREVDTSASHKGGEFIANGAEELMDDENLVLYTMK